MDELLLAVVSFLEAIILPVPPDAILIPLAYMHPEKAFYYAAIASIFSAIGGMAGYGIGNYLRPLASKICGTALKEVEKFYQKHGDLAILLSAISPIPYKVFTISSGLLGFPIKQFFVLSILGRGTRFFTVSLLGQSLEGIILCTALLLGYALLSLLKKHKVKRREYNGT